MVSVSTGATPRVSRMELLSRAIDKSLSYVVALMLVLMSATVFGNVICRYYLDASLAWYEEVSRFLLIWIVFLGAVIAYIRGDHLGIDVLLIALPPRAKHVVIVGTDLLVLASLVIMFQGGWLMTADSLESGWVASSVPIPYGYVYMVGPISALLMFVQGIIKSVADCKGLKEVWR